MRVSIGYTRKVIHKEGDEEISIELRPLETHAYQKILKLMGGLSFNGEVQKTNLEQLSNDQIIVIAKEVFPSHCRNLLNLEIVEGDAVRVGTVDDLTNLGVFLPLCLSVLMQLFALSNLTPKEAKDLKKTLSGTLQMGESLTAA